MKPLICWLGRHEWTTRIDHGEEFSVCSGCGKERRGAGGGGGDRRDREDLTSGYSASSGP